MGNSERDPNRGFGADLGGHPVNWDWRNWNKGIWNADDHRLFPPKRVGIGWTINLRELLRRLRVLD